MELGLAHHGAGRLDEAQAIYQKIIHADDRHADALHHLGLILMSKGDLAGAIEQMARSAEIAPGEAFYWVNLGAAYRKMGRLDEARGCYERAQSIEPDNAAALTNLGNVLGEQGSWEKALEAYRKAASSRGGLSEAWTGMGRALFALGKLEEAESALLRARERAPGAFEVHDLLGDVLRDQEKLPQAIESYHNAIRIRPGSAGTWLNLGVTLNMAGRIPDARAALERAREIDGRIGQVAMANLLKDQGQLDQAIQLFRAALDVEPDARVHSNLIYTIHYDPRYDGCATLKEQLEWARRYAEPLSAEEGKRTFENPRMPDRRLRIGYVSPDFRGHPVGRFLKPLLANHDRERFEIICFSNVQRGDAFTDDLKGFVDGWHETRQLNQRELAEFIAGQRIDILVDLSLHTSGNRLLTFARKPAPIQVTYLGYAGTSGMTAMDYRITDPYLDPPNAQRPFYTERLAYLNRSYWCYAPIPGTPEVGELPAKTAGRVTFGCLNNFCKVSETAQETWGEILRRNERSRLILVALEGTHRRDLLERFERWGIEPSRIELISSQPPLEYLKTYNRIDIALDPFPYPGATTTCDALWMGAPTITLAGETAVQRAGVSILSNVGMSEWIAKDRQEYVEIACRWASDLNQLAEVRRGLRHRMTNSPLMDAHALARDMERLYRGMWKEWCKTAPA